MEKRLTSRAGFTLVEMIIAITVFTIFIGFAISAYLSFHRADQDALTNRSLLMDSQAILNELSDVVRENKIDYEAYEELAGSSAFTFSGLPEFDFSGGGLALSALNEQTLHLSTPDGSEKIVYTWDADAQTLSVQRFDQDGTALVDEQLLHSENLAVTNVRFRIFPNEDPYADRINNAQYQPIVTMDLSFSMPGRMDQELTLDLRTSVTSRFYQ